MGIEESNAEFTITVEVVPPAGPDTGTVLNAKEMVGLARARFSGICVMPPFDHYEVLADKL